MFGFGRWCVLIVLVAAVSGCATPYQKPGLTGGVDDVQLAPDLYRITARGNGFTSNDRVADYVLLRASEIALSHGYPGFIVASSQDQTKTVQTTSPGYATTTFSNNSAFTTVVPPSTTTFIKPGVQVFVRLAREGGYDARIINANLSARYGVPPTSAATVPSPQTASTKWHEAVAFCKDLYKDPALDPLRGVIGVDAPVTLEMQANKSKVSDEQRKALSAYQTIETKCRDKLMAASPVVARAFAQVGTGEEELLKLYERRIAIGEYNMADKQRDEQLKTFVASNTTNSGAPPTNPNCLAITFKPVPSGLSDGEQVSGLYKSNVGRVVVKAQVRNGAPQDYFVEVGDKRPTPSSEAMREGVAACLAEKHLASPGPQSEPCNGDRFAVIIEQSALPRYVLLYRHQTDGWHYCGGGRI
jgi:hypothetical protein